MSESQPPTSADLQIRPPLQERSRRVWTRILDAGVEIVEEGGYEAFTIAAVCERAEVAPPTVYARVDTKDALFLAVYEHGIARARVDEAVFADHGRWTDLEPARLVGAVVAELAGMFQRHARFLGAVVLISGAHPEIKRRGSHHARRIGEAFTAVLLRAERHITHPDPRAAALACYETLFSALVLRTAYGPGFAIPATTDQAFTDHLAQTAIRYLLGDQTGASPWP
ncbi:TetR/AcrR family transcriptional regulator [Actinocorallia populi]|uniref:TetR/AcrR family transcriptional regulator n=1 Tax=Actinocorallia populi TaxID=2079200 RepID=UPI000D08F923|nr:TetR/AcrR family transcriptional regulator [Actinocorallia populi]